MKFILTLLLTGLVGVVMANEKPAKPHRIVFELTSEGPKQYEAVLNNVENVIKALGVGTEAVVVTHGPAIGFVLKENAQFSERMEKLTKTGATFLACENTLRKKEIPKEKLLPFVKTVDSGVAEVVRRQEAGWAYVKGGH